MEEMTSINIYLDKETKQQLRKISQEENRSMSKQIKHMIQYYIQHTK